ncbi:transmembrane emp24 domain-containing protein 5 [Biomphalaria glabrata]|uniref:Transmembrane emp24 domain-containing protein 5-like n=1 Tax=Biomphalaria glabrata TaxID=6526 RepID=A0A2C9JDM1_BIOGL|nr:transmembrane emp24 domain-containing protein 5-like [Biomphalaria glabrata]KAI8760284.1 transmembrane emp24 domain-containing protein 5-like [Biomphalaria glabrata]KAI8784082.1 transmembrane emp24 domain-containing protein 5 [Biomphalaria glabrata]
MDKLGLGTCLTLLLLNIFIKVCHNTEISLTVDISAGRQECFFETLPAKTNVEIDYQVIDGGDLDIDVLVSGPDNRVYHLDQRKTENTVKFESTQEGDYRICFDNTFSRFSNKLVFFEIYVEDGKDDDDDEEDDKKLTFEGENVQGQLDMTIEEFSGILERSKKNLERSIQVQTLIKIHEAKDRNTQEANFFRVNFFSLFQLALMISVGLVQVIVIRSLFTYQQPVSGGSLKART